jgi:hypothetical protein
MGLLRFIGIIISLALLLTSCSQKISKLEYDKQIYEYQQLNMRYELLKQESPGNITKDKTTLSDITKESNGFSTKEYNEVKRNYKALLDQHTALEKAYEELLDEHYKPREVTPPGNVPVATYNELKKEKETLDAKYVALENHYNTLKKVASNGNTSTINTAEIVEPTEIDPDKNIGKGIFEMEETSIDVNTMVVQSASFNGLYFDYDTYERTSEYLILEIAVKNNNQSTLKTIWDANKIEIISDDNQTYTSNVFRIGVDYSNKKENTLTKKIKDKNTVFVRFAFKNLPSNLKKIKSLKFMVEIDGEERMIELTHINVSQIVD